MTTAVVPVRNQPIRSVEREFLPAALEIVETPPSPIGRLGAYCLVVVFALAIIWSWFGRVDIVGRRMLDNIRSCHTNIMQPLESGVLPSIPAHDRHQGRVCDVLVGLAPSM